jgi:hypothetical protein
MNANPLLCVLACVLSGVVSVTSADDLAPMSDEFSDSKSLAQWQRVHKVERSPADQLRRIEIDRNAGTLILEPHASVWYRDYRGVLVFKPVKGDFVVTAKLNVHSRQGAGQAPRSQFSLAGLMVRVPREVAPQTWRPGRENYVFLSLGAADRPGEFQLEVKTTENSDSQLQITPGAPEAELRIARIGSALIMLRRLPGESWQVHRRYRRADFPETLQVGLTCYTDWPTCQRMEPQVHNRTVIRDGNPDLIAEVDYVRLRRPAVPQELQQSDLTDPAQVSDQQLLEFLSTE